MFTPEHRDHCVGVKLRLLLSGGEFFRDTLPMRSVSAPQKRKRVRASLLVKALTFILIETLRFTLPVLSGDKAFNSVPYHS